MTFQSPTDTMKRRLGLRESITITTGTVIGVGLFTVGANIIGIMGSAVILATLAALLISIYPSLLYAEMGGALPYLSVCLIRAGQILWHAGWLEFYYLHGCRGQRRGASL